LQLFDTIAKCDEHTDRQTNVTTMAVGRKKRDVFWR